MVYKKITETNFKMFQNAETILKTECYFCLNFQEFCDKLFSVEQKNIKGNLIKKENLLASHTFFIA